MTTKKNDNQPKVINVRMAKADKEDIAILVQFFQWLETFVEEGGEYAEDGETFRHLEDAEALQIIRNKFSRNWGPNVGSSWTRVVFGCEMLIDNCCDPNSDVLEWRPDVALLIKQEEARIAAAAEKHFAAGASPAAVLQHPPLASALTTDPTTPVILVPAVDVQPGRPPAQWVLDPHTQCSMNDGPGYPGYRCTACGRTVCTADGGPPSPCECASAETERA